jgi:3-hydroxybutyrate dehydrogenase
MPPKNKSILITGIASGLGLEMAKKFDLEGFEVFGLDINPSPQGFSFSKNCFEVDLTDYQKVSKIIQKIGPKIDILINNAGIWLEGNLEDNSPGQIHKLVEVNLISQMVLTSFLIPFLKQKKGGKIANISSIRGIKASPGRAAYCGAKFGIRGFTEALKMELEQFGIKVFGFYPAGIKTNLFKKVDKNRDLSDHLEPENVANLVFETLTKSDTDYYLSEVVIEKV